MSTAHHLLPCVAPWPVPGALHGRYPQRSDAAAPWLTPWLARQAGRLVPARHACVDAGAVRMHQAAWRALDEPTRAARLRDLRARLARSGAGSALRAEALGCVAAAMQRVLGRDPYDSQIACASVLLDDQLAEMATGEGKTLAVALAAAVGALAGVPVHVMTANDYLAARDAAALAPVFAALGLSTGVVAACSDPQARRAAYACDLTYCTAREVAFDHLRDRLHLHTLGSDLQQRVAALAGGAAPPLLLRGLCMAIVDEADSLLIDEATMPLVLAEPYDDPGHRAACFQALALARRLETGRDVQLDPASHAVHWSVEGEARLEEFSAGLGGNWLNRRHRLDLAGAALVAEHLLERDRHYLVREGRVELLDTVTGRASGVGLHVVRTRVNHERGPAVREHRVRLAAERDALRHDHALRGAVRGHREVLHVTGVRTLGALESVLLRGGVEVTARGRERRSFALRSRVHVQCMLSWLQILQVELNMDHSGHRHERGGADRLPLGVLHLDFHLALRQE